MIILDDYLHSDPFAQAPTVDGQTYWNWAQRIADGQWVGRTPFFSSPLYPYVLGLIAKLGGGPSVVYEFQLGLHVLTAVVLASVARRRFGPEVGLVAAVLFFLLAEPVTFACRIIPSTLQLLLVCLFWWQVVRAQAGPSPGSWLLAGALCGLVCLSYPAAVLVLFALGPWIVLQTPRGAGRLGCAGLAVLAGVAVISPAALHNYKVTGEFIPLTAHSGITFLQGNSPGATGVFTEVDGLTNSRDLMHFDAAELYRKAAGRDGTWRQIDRFLRNQGLEYLFGDPVRAIALVFSKGVLFFTGRTYDDILPVKNEVGAGLLHYTYLAPLATPWLVGAAVVGLASLRRKVLHHAPEFGLFLLPLLVVIVFWYSPRYRFPAVPILCVAAAIPVVGAPGRSRGARGVWLLAVSVALPLIGEGLRQLTDLDRDSAPATQFSIKLADSLARLSRVNEATQTIESAIQREPDNAELWGILGAVLAGGGDRDRAIWAYEQAVALDATNRRAKTGLAMLLIGRNAPDDLEVAIGHLQSSLGNPLFDPLCYYAIGLAERKRGAPDRAVRAFRQALEADRDYEPARAALEALDDGS